MYKMYKLYSYLWDRSIILLNHLQSIGSYYPLDLFMRLGVVERHLELV